MRPRAAAPRAAAARAALAQAAHPRPALVHAARAHAAHPRPALVRAALAHAARAFVALVALVGLAAGAPADAPLGFDHNVHARDVAVSGADPIACARCHAMKGGALVGAPDHASCFGACHGAPPVAPRGTRLALEPTRAAVCRACHTAAALAQPVEPKAFAVGYPPYLRDRDHALAIGHKTHRAVACATCHTERKGPPHRRCASCHDGTAGKGPPMTACAGCHTPASGAPEPPALIMNRDVEILVTSAFSHARHAARSAAGKQCATCHAAILETNDVQLPRPTAAGCATAGCHDGAAAFPITAACTKCHRDVPARKFDVRRPDARFSHASHAAIAPQLACATCHPLAKNGEVEVSGHAPCASCHAADFGARSPKICGACHNATEPWRALRPDRLPPERTEFGATIDHRKHPAACTSCHALSTGAVELRPPRGHAACTGKGCHSATGAPAPAMTACEACHARGRAEERLQLRLAAPWSVRDRFVHAPHRQTRDGREVACTTCHDRLAAPDLRSLEAPSKSTCAGCHDGATSFKLTGTSCTRCHPGARP